MRKEGIAVYNPDDPLEKVVQDSYHKLSGRWLTMYEVKSFIEAVVAYDGLYEQFLSVPENICDDIFHAADGTTTLYIPCYPFELRSILRKQQISAPYRIAAFTNHPAKQLLTEYPVLIALDREKLLRVQKDALQTGGVVIFDNTLHLNGSVVRILSRERGDSDVTNTVIKIVREECPHATVHAIAEPPGLAHPLQRAASVLPVVTVKEAVERTSGKYYDDMKEMGEKPNRIAWMCGHVYAYDYKKEDADEENIKIFFDNEEAKYELKMTGPDDFSNTELKKLVGKRVCAKGTVEAYVFTISEYRLDEKPLQDDQVYMAREKPSDMTSYRIGDHVKHRKRGLAFKQIIGKVTKIKGNLMFVKWEDVEDLEVFNLNDTVALSALLEKA